MARKEIIICDICGSDDNAKPFSLCVDRRMDAAGSMEDVIESPNKTCMEYSERTEHPTQKPVALFITLIKWLTNEGDLILDPFIGSGTTAIAAIRTNRHYIGMEISPEYCAIADERIRAEQAQLRLL